MSKTLSACSRLLVEGIRIFRHEFDYEDRETQKLILKNASVNFGIIAETLDQFISVDDCIKEWFSEYSSLLESAWAKF